MCLESTLKSYFNHFGWFRGNLVTFDFSGEIRLLVRHECEIFAFFSSKFQKIDLGGPEMVVEHPGRVLRHSWGLRDSRGVQRTSNFDCAIAIE